MIVRNREYNYNNAVILTWKTVKEFLYDTNGKGLWGMGYGIWIKGLRKTGIALKQKYKYPVDYRNSGTGFHVLNKF